MLIGPHLAQRHVEQGEAELLEAVHGAEHHGQRRDRAVPVPVHVLVPAQWALQIFSVQFTSHSVLVQSLHADVRGRRGHQLQLQRVLRQVVELSTGEVRSDPCWHCSEPYLVQQVGGDDEIGVHLLLLGLVDVLAPDETGELG